MIETAARKRRVQLGTLLQGQRLTVAAAALAIFLALLIPVLVAGPSLAKPYLMDEMEFPSVARAIAASGQPVYYRSELYPANVGLWHPPLYIGWYAAWMKLFGTSTVAGRTFGLFNLCLTLIVLGTFAARRWPAMAGGSLRRLLLWGALLGGLCAAATSPLFIQGSILPDIDTQVLPLTLTAFLLLMFELRRQGVAERRYWVAFTIGALIQLYAKLPALLLLIPTFAVFELARALEQRRIVRIRLRRSKHDASGTPGDYRLLIVASRGALRVLVGPLLVIAALVVALVILVISWYIIASVWGVSFSLPFIYLTQSSNNPANFAGSGGIIAAVLANAPEHFGYALQWIGLPTLLFIVLLIVREFRAPAQGLLSRPERAALYTFFLVLLALYIVLKPAPFAFPKYYPPLIPPYALLAIDLLTALQRERRGWISLALLGGLVALYLCFMWLNQRIAEQDFILVYYTIWPKDPAMQSWMLKPLLVAAAIATTVSLLVRRNFLAYLAVAALAVAIGWQTNVAAHQARAPYSTTYYYGEQSMDQLTEYLRGSLPADAALIAPKDVGYQLQDRWRYYELPADPRPLLEMPGVQYLVFRELDYYGNTIRDTPEIFAAVNADFVLETKVGAFVVMRKK